MRSRCRVRFAFPHAPVHLICFLELSLTYDELYNLYVNDPGDHDLVDHEEDVAGLHSFADFLQDIVD